VLVLRITSVSQPNQRDTSRLPIGYFGASTGAAAALVTAAELPNRVGAVVSRGGRPDLAKPALTRVCAPRLLIVGGNDFAVVELNRAALAQLRCKKRLMIIPGATSSKSQERSTKSRRAVFCKALTSGETEFPR
jgi:pimeloyl-ACP methyl ester carboxylesterase